MPEVCCYLENRGYPPHVYYTRAKILAGGEEESKERDAKTEGEKEELDDEDSSKVDGEDGEARHAEHAQDGAQGRKEETLGVGPLALLTPDSLFFRSNISSSSGRERR